ncbi:ABC transporter substrate-binding protein [Nocardiopsis sediminis]|uniref:ABC transporter substrate-binding protein n=1 Tax=Nocardiopsis sediminis TaxID=1778267 RepID=A0ABV8FGI2_9ACTN
MRPVLRSAAVLAALAVAATGCGGGGSDDGVVELRFSWWGADERHTRTQEVIDRFEAAHPDIRITGEYTDWDSYWDRLATSTAANDAPDIISQEDRYLREYADRGALLDLTEYGEQLDLGEIDELALTSGQLEDGTFGIASGINVATIMADPELYDQAGVEMPDDENWTWDEFIETSAAITEATDGEVYGTQAMGVTEGPFQMFARQHGESMYTDDGQLGFSPETMEAWWEIVARIHEEEAAHGAAESVEIDAGGPDLSTVATGSGAMAHFWTNQFGVISNASGHELELLRFPGETEFEQPGVFLKPAMFYSISAGTDHPEEAAMFVDYLLNDVEAAEIILADRGLAANTRLRDETRDALPPADAATADYIDEVTPDVAGPLQVPPIGAGEVVDIFKRINEEVMFGRLTPAEATDQLMSEVETAIGSG